MSRLPPSLAGPVAVELAKAAERIPTERAMPGGAVYELKWDGYRQIIVRTGQGVALWSGNGKNLTTRFPDIEAAAREQIPSRRRR